MSRIARARAQLALVQMLLDAGAGPHLQDPEGQTPLHVASGIAGNVQIVKALLASGADPTIKDIGGRSPAELVRDLMPGSPGGKDVAGRLLLSVTGLGDAIDARRQSMLRILQLLGEPASGDAIPAATEN